MNFVLVHFLVKLAVGSGLLAVQIVSLQAQQEAKWKRFITSASESSLSDGMDCVEDNKSALGRKGLSYRKSYSSIAEHEDGMPLQSVEMRREVSSGQSSVKSQTSASSLLSESNYSKDTVEDMAVPGQPLNFGTVVPGVYRSSYPKETDYPFLQKLGLKTIM